jgi:hypothetical protein
MLGGTAYVAHRAGQNQMENQYRESEQEARLQQLEQQQRYAAAPPPPPAGGGTDVVAELQKLASLKDAGALSQAEFDAAKAKLLA